MEYLWTDYRRDATYISDVAPNFPFEERDGVKINFLVRFGKIFLPLFKSLAPEDRREVENIFYHFLAQLDRTCGKHKFSFVEELLGEEIAKNFYGDRAGDIFRKLTSNEQRKIARLLRLQEACEGRRLFFREAIATFFPGAKIYFYEDEKKFLLWIPQQENSERKNIPELLTILFLEISCKPPEIFWGNHFGIIDAPETMRPDQITIY